MAERLSTDDSTLVEHKSALLTPRLFRVLLHNDDFTTMDFVVFVLEHFFAKPSSEAAHLMLQVHQQGHCVAGCYTGEIAESKVVEVRLEAERQEMPLLVTAEPA